jgi:hypothetical protein
MRSFPYLLATATSMNLTNSSGVRLVVTVGVAVAVVVMARTVSLITPERVFWKHASFLLLECPPLCLGQIFHCHPDRVVRPNLGPGSSILQVHHGFEKSAYITDYLAKLGATINT